MAANTRMDWRNYLWTTMGQSTGTAMDFIGYLEYPLHLAILACS